MGNHKFRFSDMLPNSWFYKLRDMSKTKNHKTSTSKKKKPLQNSPFSQPRSSFYYTTESIRGGNIYNSHDYFPDPPRKSSNKKTKRKTIYKPSPKHIPNSYKFPELDFLNSPSSESKSDSHSFNELASCQFSSSATDIIIDMNGKVQTKEFKNLNAGYDTISELDLPPILTKHSKSSKFRNLDSKQVSVKTRKDKEAKYFSNSFGVKLRTNSTKRASKKISVSLKKRSKPKKESFSAESFAIVKTSTDPEKDFRESMIEMVVENNIKASKDLENLLACYLSLNSDEYHGLIIKAFQEIWFNFPDLHL
ncbi:transcription repressor OFP3-like [Nicotiana tabacum]|uniref:Transcription repressor n=1 Tax=Nicotiana tabacum TaxID=4097 RepID=A0A1S3X8Q6_TOBAC|nr:transcription repressor OFP3-like isoform X1 [Nicotiana tomentosiformis]